MIWFYKNNARAIGKRNHLIMNILKDCRRKNSYDDEHGEVMGSRLPTFDICNGNLEGDCEVCDSLP